MKQQFNNLKKQLGGASGNGSNPTSKLDAYLVRAQMFVQEFLNRAGKPVDTMYKVAVERYQQGEYADAANRLRMVTKFQKDNADAWYLLGSADLAQGNEKIAAISLKRALALNPQHEEARFMLAVADPYALPHEQQPKFAPLSLAITHFDGQALYYDEENLDELGYTGHEECYDAIKRYLNPNYSDFKILDLGCGTGLSGLQFRDIAGHIDGVDISQNMLDLADTRRDEREGRVYDKLHLMDLRRYLLECPAGSYDIILAANTLPYLGGLTPVFDGVNQALKAGGVFTFSVEPVSELDYGLVPGEGRYAHSEDYIAAQAARVGFDVLEVKPFEMFAGSEALQFVLRKPAPKGQQAPQQPAAPQTSQQQAAPQQPAPPTPPNQGGGNAGGGSQGGGGFPPAG